MDSALYRRYRPQTFAEVIGQEHVTEPLMAALRSGRISHAFLFSGPRGCGKTSSARILARCLNCAQGPTDVPCGECESCQELGLGGRGSLDVVEIDAASHNGVDDARDLRERALANPTRDRFKIFILDEAHMVTPQGFNALLKIVEEPPPHVKFIFATTEADKVIGTIRSRTHHYPFRLVPPEKMTAFLAQLCEREGIKADDGVLPLVVRAGAGSVRDAESVLDQLMAGADDGSIKYDSAVALLGYTPATLLDETVEAFAHDDGAALFGVVDQVIEAGQDPRRFTEDLLERLRDLIVIAAAGDKAQAVLHSLPADQWERMRTTAGQFGLARLSRAGDLINEGLAQMTGATAPRLQLELLCARVLAPDVPGQAPGAAPTATSGAAPATSVPAGESPAARPTAGSAPGGGTRPAAGRPHGSDVATPDSSGPGARPDTTSETTAPAAQFRPGPGHSGSGPRPVEPPSEPPARPAEPTSSTSGDAPAASGISMAAMRDNWDRLLDELSRIRKASWALLRDNARLVSLDGSTMTLGFVSANLATAFRSGGHADTVGQAIQRVFGSSLQIATTVEDGPRPTTGRAAPLAAVPASSRPSRGTGDPAPAERPANVVPLDERRSQAGSRDGSGSRPAQPSPIAPDSPATPEPPDEPPDETHPDSRPTLRVVPGSATAASESPASSSPASPSSAPSASSSRPAEPSSPAQDESSDPARPDEQEDPHDSQPPPPDDAEDAPSDDDPEVDSTTDTGASLIEKMLGGTIIEETDETES